MNDLLLSLLLSLGSTEALECAVAFAMKKRGKTLLLCALVNFITNPPVVLLCHFFGRGWLLVVCLEALVILAEGWLYRYSSRFDRPFLFSLSANVLSCTLGLCIDQMI